MKVILSIIGLFTASFLAADGEISSELSGSAQVQVSTSPGQTWPPAMVEADSTTEWGISAEWLGFQAQWLGGLAVGARQNSWRVSQAWVGWGESLPVSLRLGWWPEPTGPALFRSLVPTFRAVSGTAFLASAGTAQPASPPKGRVTLGWGEWGLSAEMAVGALPIDIPDLGSTWFPRKDVPFEFVTSWQTYRLNHLSIGDAAPTTRLPFAPSWRSELRWSALWGDLSLGLFQGDDPQVIFPYEVTLPASGFDLTLLPRRNSVIIPWTTLEVPFGSGKVWAEQRITTGRLRTDEGWDHTANGKLIQATSATNVWEGLMGSSYSVSGGPWGTLRAWVEGSLHRDLLDPGRQAPEFTEGWAGGLSWDEARGQVNFAMMGGAPWDLCQGWMWSRATWSGGEGRTLWLGLPLFWGKNDTEWGQFANRKVVAVGTTYHW